MWVPQKAFDVSVLATVMMRNVAHNGKPELDVPAFNQFRVLPENPRDCRNIRERADDPRIFILTVT